MSNPNIIVLSGDSLRYDRATDPDCMPYVASSASEATSFRNAVSNAGFTPGSFPTLMASRYPSSIEGVGIPEDGNLTTLAEQLSERGYACGIWSDNKFVGPDYNYDRGYEAGRGYRTSLRDNVRNVVDEDGLLFKLLELGYMRIWQRMKNGVGESHYYAPAVDLNSQARQWLDGMDPDADSVHLWVHYMDSHHPYEPPSDWMPTDLEVVEDRTDANNVTRKVCGQDGEGCSDAEIRDAVRLYDAECAYLDEQIRSFVEDFLVPQGWLTEEDVLVITSDHGEIIDEYEKWGEFGHGNYFCEECTRVPLIVDAPGLDGGAVDAQVSLVDLVPTVVDLLGLDPDDRLLGESLVPVAAGEETRETILYDGTLGYHGARDADGAKRFNTERTGEDEYVDAVADYDELPYVEDVVTGDDRHRELEAFIRETLSELESLAEGNRAVDPDSLQVEQHMRDLGYLE